MNTYFGSRIHLEDVNDVDAIAHAIHLLSLQLFTQCVKSCSPPIPIEDVAKAITIAIVHDSSDPLTLSLSGSISMKFAIPDGYSLEIKEDA